MKIHKRIEPGSPCEPNIDKYGIEKRWNFIRQNLKLETNNNKMRILDVGYGYGIYVEKCSAYASEVIGIDIFKEHLNIAKEHKKDNTYLVLNTAEHLAFKDDSFDAIICIETLEHIPSDEKALKEFSRILKTGGILIVTGANRLLPFETHVEGLGGKSVGIGLMRRFRFIPARLRRITHIARDYTPLALKKLLTRNGFKVKQLDFLMPTFEHSMKDKDIPRGIPFTAVFKFFNFLGHKSLFKKIFGLTIIICCEKEQSKTDRTNKNVFICFIGIDGSGKTTLAKTLIENMSKYGIKTEYTWGKFESSLLKLLIFFKNTLFVREGDWKKSYEISRGIKKNLFKSRFAYALYEWFVLLDYRFQIIRKIAIPLKLGKNLVCDRYVYDTVVDLAVDLGYSDEKVTNRINQLLDFSPKPDLVFLVDLPEDVAFNRKDDVPSVEFLYEKRKVYKKIKEEFEMIGLDGTKSLEELNDKIEKEVFKLQTTKEGCVG